jgi:oligopeptidase A
MPANDHKNPLLSPQLRIPFDEIRAEHAEPAIRELIADAKARQSAIGSAPGSRSYANTMAALDSMTDRLDYALGLVRHLESVATTPELRAAHNTVEPMASAYYSSIPLDEDLWNAVKIYAATPEAARLAGARRRFLAETVRNFRKHGAELPAERKARLSEIEIELSTLTTRFAQNVLDATNAFELLISDEKHLAGLPPSAVDAARQSAQDKGIEGWRFTLQSPSYTAVMTYLDDATIREHVWRAYTTRGTSGQFDNRGLIQRILALRREKAQLTGYGDFADYALDGRMAKNGSAARQFLNDLKARTERHFHSENRALSEFRRQIEGKTTTMQPWDVSYWAEKQRASLYDFDEEALRPYFQLERVVAGLFEIAQRLFGVSITGETGAPVWDQHVQHYSVRNERSNLLGLFYADWRPRENKRGGAWMDGIITGVTRGGTLEPHVGVICGNLTPPAAGKPALLTHREVETIFHEFGHLLHHLLSRVEVRGLAGTNVAWDFVELPSQIMENWCWERESLDLFARHYQTGEPLPEDLFQKMKRARSFRGANSQMRQLGFGAVDMALHTQYSPEKEPDVIAYSRRIIQEFSPAELPDEHAMIAAFTHLFADPTGYAAAYYSYKWAEVLDADAFTRFRANGIFNTETGRRFRDIILSSGASQDPADLYRAFMGRDPDSRALMERLGLA